MDDCDRPAADGASCALDARLAEVEPRAYADDGWLREAGNGFAPWAALRLKVLIEERLEGSLRVRDLASIARLSRSHFSRVFSSTFGDTPHRYITRRRMERASVLMLTTEASLGQIAAECGLVDQPHFTRLFRRHFGESPGAWRYARRKAVRALAATHP